MSGVGKGVTTASIGKVLQGKGFRVTAIKIDPYVNVDAGTMNPLEHGEVFVTDDGMECDQDMGNYERFLEEDLSAANYLTTGRVYLSVIQKERNLEYGGKTVEVVLHIPEEVIRRIRGAARETKADIVLVEIGGTVGDYQNVLFLEAARIMKRKDPKNVLVLLTTWLPVMKNLGEMKTKPTQHAIRELQGIGIQPDMVVARSEQPLDDVRKKKISMFGNVDPSDVISAPDVDVIYEIPLRFEEDRLGNRILSKFGLRPRTADLAAWRSLLSSVKELDREVRIGIVGKYFQTGDFTLSDAYLSVIEAIKHAAWAEKRVPKITWLSAQAYEDDPAALRELASFDGILVPGGFGNRGTEGKIRAIKYCRENGIPFFGLCLGLQLAVIEFARSVCGLEKASSVEFAPRGEIDPVIDVMPDQQVLLEERRYGGTMRLGGYACSLKKGSLAQRSYGTDAVRERHRHRYEVNNKYRDMLERAGLVVSGVNPERNLVEIAELKAHPFFLGTQFHPEFTSRPLRPHPLFRAFVRAASAKRS